MSVALRRWLTVTLAALVPALVLMLPAAAQPVGGESPVTCDPADPDPGTTTNCTAEGLAPDSPFTWEADFADGSTRSGDGTADAEGVGTFEVPVPEGEEAEGEYTVTVTGTTEEGEPYEEQHQGTVGGGGPLDALGLPSAPDEGTPSEEPSEGEGSEEPAPGGDDGDTFGAPDSGDESQVDPVPSGAVAAGLGGTSTDPTPLRAVAVVLFAMAVIGHLATRRHTAIGTTDR